MKHRVHLLLLISVACVMTKVAWGLYHPSIITRPPPSAISSQNVETSQWLALQQTPFQWKELESEDYVTYMGKLRAAGCPEETIADIILCDINKLYESRRQQEEFAAPAEYWRTHHWNAGVELERQRKWKTLEDEKQQLISQLLGQAAAREYQKKVNDPLAKGYQFLPEEKQEDVRKVMQKFNELQQEVWARGVFEQEDRDELRNLQSREIKELAEILTPSQVEEFDLRTSQLSIQLRHELRNFNPTELEFRSIYGIKKTREKDLEMPLDFADKAARERRNKAMEQTDREIKQVLGTPRFGEYKRCNDADYQNLERFAQRNGLDRSVAIDVYETKKSVEAAFRQITNDETMQETEKKSALLQLHEAAQEDLRKKFGNQTAYERYLVRHGWWLRNLRTQAEPHPTRELRP